MGILVTGGAGFIGANLCAELLATGWDVTAVDNLSEGKLDNLRPFRGHERFEFVKADVRDRETMVRLCDRKTAVIHLAACSRIQPSISDPMLAWDNNVVGLGSVLEASRTTGVRRFVFASSSSVYAESGRSEDGSFSEGAELMCRNPYSLSKKVGEEMVDLYRRLYGMSTISFRFHNVYGPMHQEDGPYATVIAIFRRQKRLGQPLTIVGDGKQRRDFTFVTDITRGLVMGALNQEVTGVINLGTGVDLSINEVAALVAPGHPTVNIPERLGEARNTKASIHLARTFLGWKPEIAVDRGLSMIDQFERFNPPSGIVIA